MLGTLGYLPALFQPPPAPVAVLEDGAFHLLCQRVPGHADISSPKLRLKVLNLCLV
jgi:hypothetical protein